MAPLRHRISPLGSSLKITKVVRNQPSMLCLGLYRSKVGLTLVPYLPSRWRFTRFRLPRFSSRPSNQRPAPTPQQHSHYQQQPLIHNPPPLLPSPQAKRSTPDHCLLYMYNKRDGGCPYGSDCKFKHRCSLCRTEGHPVTRCPNKHTA